MTKLFNLSMDDINLNGFLVFFVLSRAWDKERILTVPMRNRTSDLRIPRSNTLPLSQRDSTVSVVYFEVLMRFSLVCMIFNRATSRNLPSQSSCGTKVSLTCRRRCPYIAQACYIILGGSTYFTLLRFGLIAILWTFSRFNTHSGSQTERNFDGNCERIPFFKSKR